MGPGTRVCLAGAEDVIRLVEDRVVEEHRRNRGEEGDDAEDTGDQRGLPVWVDLTPPSEGMG
jgi:hypothetical protein